MDFIEANPRDAEVEENKPEEVKFKWEDYHQEQLAEHQFDDEDDDWMIGTKKMKKALSLFTNLNA